MATAKTTTLTCCRIESELKEALRTAAEREHRSIANMVAALILDYCDRKRYRSYVNTGKGAFRLIQFQALPPLSLQAKRRAPRRATPCQDSGSPACRAPALH